MIHTIFWDVDGTLLDFLRSEDWSLRRCLRELGVEATDAQIERYSAINTRRWQALERGEIRREEVLLGRFREFFAAEGIACPDIPAFNLAYQTGLGSVFFPIDDSIALVARLRGRVRQYAVTNGSALAQEKKLALSGLDRLFDGVFISEHLGAEKPDEAFFRAVFDRIGPMDKSGAVILGDSLTSDMLGGVRAGLRCWWFNPSGKPNASGLPLERELRSLREVEPLLDAEQTGVI